MNPHDVGCAAARFVLICMYISMSSSRRTVGPVQPLVRYFFADGRGEIAQGRSEKWAKRRRQLFLSFSLRICDLMFEKRETRTSWKNTVSNIGANASLSFPYKLEGHRRAEYPPGISVFANEINW